MFNFLASLLITLYRRGGTDMLTSCQENSRLSDPQTLSRIPLPKYLSNARIGRAVSDNFHNFPKLPIYNPYTGTNVTHLTTYYINFL